MVSKYNIDGLKIFVIMINLIVIKSTFYLSLLVVSQLKEFVIRERKVTKSWKIIEEVLF